MRVGCFDGSYRLPTKSELWSQKYILLFLFFFVDNIGRHLFLYRGRGGDIIGPHPWVQLLQQVLSPFWLEIIIREKESPVH